MMDEYVKISLDRYNGFLDDSKKADLLYRTIENLAKIIDNENFDWDKPIHSEVYKIYERLVNEV